VFDSASHPPDLGGSAYKAAGYKEARLIFYQLSNGSPVHRHPSGMPTKITPLLAASDALSILELKIPRTLPAAGVGPTLGEFTGMTLKAPSRRR